MWQWKLDSAKVLCNLKTHGKKLLRNSTSLTNYAAAGEIIKQLTKPNNQIKQAHVTQPACGSDAQSSAYGAHEGAYGGVLILLAHIWCICVCGAYGAYGAYGNVVS